MNAVVVFESMFGNTRDIATAIADGLATRCDVRCFEVSTAPHVLDHPDLLVVGGPTHAFSMSRTATRDSAGSEINEPLISSTGIREWLGDVELDSGQSFATFDTKVPKPKLPGSAAASASKRLRKLRGTMFAAPETFWVADTTGPLRDGEIERARTWAVGLSQSLEHASAEGRRRA